MTRLESATNHKRSDTDEIITSSWTNTAILGTETRSSRASDSVTVSPALTSAAKQHHNPKKKDEGQSVANLEAQESIKRRRCANDGEELDTGHNQRDPCWARRFNQEGLWPDSSSYGSAPGPVARPEGASNATLLDAIHHLCRPKLESVPAQLSWDALTSRTAGLGRETT